MKNVIAYHQVKPGTDCPDAICACWIAARFFGCDNIELFPLLHQDKKDYFQADFKIPFPYVGRDVIMLDFCYPAHILTRIAESARSFTLLDHHIDKLPDFTKVMDSVLGKLDVNECGATLTWKYFFPQEPMPWFLNYIRQRDIGVDGYYDGEIPESEAINEEISTMRKGKLGALSFEVFNQLYSLSPTELINTGMPKIKERNQLCLQEIALWEEHPTVISLSGYLVPLLKIGDIEVDRHYSVLGALFALKYKHEFPFVVVQTTEETDRISLRSHSSSTLNLSVIANEYGGGGQFHAAGCLLP